MLPSAIMHTIQRLGELGQSVWLDFLDHELLVSRELDRLIAEDGLRGLTSNPTIFQKAIAATHDYDELVRAASASESSAAVFERLAVAEVGRACDALRGTYEATCGADGFASIEVSPHAAGSTLESIAEARRLWSSVGRPNVMVKIPGTRAGLGAIERCLAEGINVNVTLLFSVERYREVAHAYLRALEAGVAAGKPIERLASVASFFVSRVDTKVDKALDALVAPAARAPLATRATRATPEARPEAERSRAAGLRGRCAIANARLAFVESERILTSERWRRLAAEGARPQRLLWASTSPKDPAYPDLYYAEALICAGSVDTMTKDTLRAYVDHGRPEPRLERSDADELDPAPALAALGLDFAAMMQELEDEGVRSFAASYDQAVAAIASKRRLQRSA
jgi:transaldolase